jgi:CheY-like chemotaxis protein
MDEESRKRILLVDDEPDILAVMAAVLSNGGYEVIKASSGKEAIDLAQVKHPDLILMDIKMPDMDGVRATDILKSNPSTKNMPIAYLTNLVDEHQAVDGHVTGSKIGGLFFIPKTSKPDKKIQLVEKTLASVN